MIGHILKILFGLLNRCLNFSWFANSPTLLIFPVHKRGTSASNWTLPRKSTADGGSLSSGPSQACQPLPEQSPPDGHRCCRPVFSSMGTPNQTSYARTKVSQDETYGDKSIEDSHKQSEKRLQYNCWGIASRQA